ncbi:MAG: hypothetical protein AAGA42_13055 [Actinomycetota bacterium]
MTDRRVDPAPNEPDPLGRWVRRTAATVPTTDTDAGLRRIERSVDVRRRRRRVGVPLAAAAVVGIGALAVVASSGTSNSTVMTPTDSGVVTVPLPVTSPSTITENTTLDLVAPSTVEQSAVTTAETTSVPVADLPPPQQITTFDVEPITIQAPSGVAQLDQSGDVLSFRDGFAVTRPTFIGTPGFALTVQDAQILLGLDLAILIEDSGATTQEEAIAVATDAGFLDRMNAALAEEPQVLDALLNHKWTPGLDVFLTDDGTTWRQTVLELPVERGRITDVVSGGDHLAIAVTDDMPDDDGFRDFDVTIIVTSDLQNFEVHEWTVPDPLRELDGPLMSSSYGRLVAFPDGWAYALYPIVSLESSLILDDLVGADQSQAGMTMSDERVLLDVRRRDGSTERFEFTWEELGLDPETTAMLRSPNPVTVWSASLNGEPAAESVPGGAVLAIAPTQTGYVLTGLDSVTFVDVPGRSASFAVPAGFEAGDAVATATGAVVTLIDTDFGATRTMLDRASGRWTPIEFDRIGNDRELRFYSESPWPVVGHEQDLPERVASTATWQQGDYVYTWVSDGPRWSYEVRTIDGALVVAENPEPDPHSALQARLEHLRTGVAGTIITDPATGEVVIDLSPDEMTEMDMSATRLDGTALSEYGDGNPLLWLLGETGDQRWFMHELGVPDFNPDNGAVDAAITGDTILAVDGDRWQRFDL